MRNIVIVTALLLGLIAPVLAADAPTALETKVNSLESNNAALTEDLGNARLDLDKTKADMLKRFVDEAQARKALEQTITDQLTQLQKALTAEIAARGESDKQIAELQAQLTSQKLTIAKLQSDLDAEKIARGKAEIELAKTVDHNRRVEKTDRTVGYGLSALLLGLSLRH